MKEKKYSQNIKIPFNWFKIDFNSASITKGKFNLSHIWCFKFRSESNIKNPSLNKICCDLVISSSGIINFFWMSSKISQVFELSEITK